MAVLAGLARLDQVAYIRFASVYKDFQQISDFQQELVSLRKKEPAKRREAAGSADPREILDVVGQEISKPHDVDERALAVHNPRSVRMTGM